MGSIRYRMSYCNDCGKSFRTGDEYWDLGFGPICNECKEDYLARCCYTYDEYEALENETREEEFSRRRKKKDYEDW